MNRYVTIAILLVAFLFPVITKATECEEARREEFRTSDGVVLAAKHYENSGRPIILIHGVAANDRYFDIPYKHFSMARFLCRSGMDVWIVNLRGVGTSGYRSGTTRDFTIDDNVIYDMPAIVDGVYQATGKKPVMLGHSMGAWVLSGYLQGLVYEHGSKVIADRLIAKKRQELINGIIMLAPGISIRWEYSLKYLLKHPEIIKKYKESLIWETNPLLESVARSRILRVFLLAKEEVSPKLLRSLLWLPLNKIPFIGKDLWRLFDLGLHSLSEKTLLFYMAMNPENVDVEAAHVALKDGVDVISGKVGIQLANATKTKKPFSYYPGIFRSKPPARAYNYLQHLNDVMVPTLVLGGGKDVVVNHAAVYHDVFREIGSTDKRYVDLPEYGHFDFFIAKNVEKDVYQLVADWVEARN